MASNSSELWPIEKMAYFQNNIRTKKSQIVVHLNSDIKQAWENIFLLKLQQLVSSVPKWLQCCKSRWCNAVVNMLILKPETIL